MKYFNFYKRFYDFSKNEVVYAKLFSVSEKHFFGSFINDNLSLKLSVKERVNLKFLEEAIKARISDDIDVSMSILDDIRKAYLRFDENSYKDAKGLLKDFDMYEDFICNDNEILGRINLLKIMEDVKGENKKEIYADLFIKENVVRN